MEATDPMGYYSWLILGASLQKVLAATGLHFSWYLKILKNTLRLLKTILNQIHECIHTFVRPGRNLKKMLYFGKYKKRENSDRKDSSFFLYTVRNLFFFYSQKQNEISTKINLPRVFGMCICIPGKKNNFFWNFKTRILKCLNIESTGARVLQPRCFMQVQAVKVGHSIDGSWSINDGPEVSRKLDIHSLAVERFNENYSSREEPVGVPHFRGSCHLWLPEFDGKL